MKLEYGTVSAWDAKTCRIRVNVHENGLTTYWLQVPQGYGKKTKRRCPVALGAQVAILLKDDGVDGLLLGTIYSSAEPPPVTDDDTDYIEYSDGTKISYSPSAHKLDISLAQGTLNITAPAGLTINAPVGVTINAMAGVAINAGAGTTVKGIVNVQGDIIAEGISLKNHTHSGVQSGLSNTGKPQ